MASLRELIEQGEYELAAHLLLYGALHAYLEQRHGNGAYVRQPDTQHERSSHDPGVAGVRNLG